MSDEAEPTGSAPDSGAPGYRAPQAESLLRQAIELVEEARPMPLSASSMINKEELLAVLTAAVQGLPEELRSARWLLKERDDFLARVQGEGDEAETIAVKALGLAEEHAEGWKPFVHGVLAQIELGRGNLDKADDYISLTFADQRIEATTTLFRDFHGAAAKIFASKGKGELAAQHSAALDRLDTQTQKIKDPS